MVRKKQNVAKRLRKNIWSVYILRCGDDTLYTGVTNNIERRIEMHNNGFGARYTNGRGPVVLVYQHNGMTRSQALVREYKIKAMSKKAKEKLVQ